MVKFKSFEFEEISHGGRLKLNESPKINQFIGQQSKMKLIASPTLECSCTDCGLGPD